ncbi:hypothetical protein GGR57DRAFT_457396 [Xylariaceae sp. FL1272]|nr:hypothetical protein GGR57DRAFT_457396 [Xylariaceae sp. FL1272]
MDSNMMNTQMGPAAFFYYTPDPNPENRQHGHFSQHPGFQQMQPHMYPVVPTLPSTPMYSRPNSSSSQLAVPAKVFAPVPSNLTPMQSPQRRGVILAGHPSKLMLETDTVDNDSFYYPATPALSTSGSSMGSPAHIPDILATPLNPMFSGLDGCEMIKADEEAIPKPVDGQDWSSCGSPPLTPVYLQHFQEHHPGNSISLSTNIPCDLVSASHTVATPVSSASPSCPSLSPSPSPNSESLDFCDPRNLTVGGAISAPSPIEFTTPANLQTHSGNGSTKELTFAASFEFNPVVPHGLSAYAEQHGLPSFDDISDLESEDDFVSRLVNIGEQPQSEAKRSRSATCSTTLSLGHDSFLTETDFSYQDPTACALDSLHALVALPDSDSHKDKKFKRSKESSTPGPTMNVAADSTSQQGEQRETSTQSEANGANNNASSGTGSDVTPAPLPAPPNRRGRKQSLTEDPSKTFVCELCNRRFRRQEHLKRHYRSLHTQDKPFKCSECHKSFSRSDNLAQHARTHGSGAIVMNILDGSEESLDMMASADGDYHNFGKVLFQVASEIPGSSSDSSDDSQSEGAGKKKRKRPE